MRQRLARYLTIVAGLTLAAAAAADAQETRIPPGGATRGLGSGLPTQRADAPGEILSPSLLDTPVDRDSYVLGPGDLLDVSIFGELSHTLRLPVTPEGTLVIPTVGVAEVMGLDLNQAEARVRALVSRQYRNVELRLTLSRIREFKVFVVGDVPAPGVRTASAATRVSEVLPLQDDTLREALPRNILLRRASGDTVRVDLARFRLLGDLSANPTLREGDAVIVPVVNETVEVHGRVAFPGLYEFRPGETLADLLRLANAGQGFLSNAADSVRVSRFVGPAGREFHVFSRAEAVGPIGEEFLLRPLDALYVARVSDYKMQATATILGEVRYPGTYPIRPDTTTIRDLVSLAGGLTPNASLAGASLRRQLADTTANRFQQLEALPPHLLNNRERRILEAGSQGNERNVVVDFRRLFAEGEDAYNQVLQAGDTLIVPEHRGEVVILGAVLEPGIVQHSPGKRADYFVRLAGGYTRQADRGDAVVVKASSGNRIDADEVAAIEPGDAIVVPFRERRNYLQLLQTTSAVVTTVSGLVLTFWALFR